MGWSRFDLTQSECTQSGDTGSWVMKRFVHRQNITHFREMLKTVTDVKEREKLRKLLAEEEAALDKAEQEYRQKK